MRLRNFIIYSVVVLSSAQFTVQAKSKYMERPDFNTRYEDVFMPELAGGSIVIDDSKDLPNAPIITKTTFVKLPEVIGIDDRVKRLMEGITEIIPPKYDHYGYEIRRYMQNAGDIRIYSNDEFLREQIVNVRRAGVIADFWKRELENEIAYLQEQLDAKPEENLSTKATLKRNEAEIRRFVIVLNSWIMLNEKILLLIFKDQDFYSVIYPEVIVSSGREKIALYNLMNAKQTRLKDLKRYAPFEIMFY